MTEPSVFASAEAPTPPVAPTSAPATAPPATTATGGKKDAKADAASGVHPRHLAYATAGAGTLITSAALYTVSPWAAGGALAAGATGVAAHRIAKHRRARKATEGGDPAKAKDSTASPRSRSRWRERRNARNAARTTARGDSPAGPGSKSAPTGRSVRHPFRRKATPSATPDGKAPAGKPTAAAAKRRPFSRKPTEPRASKSASDGPAPKGRADKGRADKGRADKGRADKGERGSPWPFRRKNPGAPKSQTEKTSGGPRPPKEPKATKSPRKPKTPKTPQTPKIPKTSKPSKPSKGTATPPQGDKKPPDALTPPPKRPKRPWWKPRRKPQPAPDTSATPPPWSRSTIWDTPGRSRTPKPPPSPAPSPPPDDSNIEDAEVVPTPESASHAPRWRTPLPLRAAPPVSRKRARPAEHFEGAPMSAPITDASTATTRESTVTTAESRANQSAGDFDTLAHTMRARAGAEADMPDMQESHDEFQQEATRLEQNAEIRRGEARAAAFIRRMRGM